MSEPAPPGPRRSLGRHSIRLAASTCLAALFAAPSAAIAAEPGVLKSPHTEESHVIVGLKGTFVREHAEEEIEQGAGLGSFVETTLIEHHLELELGVVGILPGETAAQLAFEPLLKLGFHLAESVDPYVGVGPIVLWGAELPHLRGGGQAVVGSYFWVHPRFGIDMDVGFALLSGERDLTDEVTLGLGPIVRF